MSTIPLLRLPVEIRLQIFEHLFTDTYCNIQVYKNNVHLCRAFPTCPPLPLLLTSRTISNEVQQVLYNETVFRIQLHVQQTPMIEQQRTLSRGGATSCAVLPKYGFQTILNVAISTAKYLRGIRRLELDVWLCDHGKVDDMLQQIEEFKTALGGNERILTSVKIRLRLRPRWLRELFKDTTMGQGAADGIVEALMGLKCLGGKREVVIEDEVWPMVSRGIIVGGR